MAPKHPRHRIHQKDAPSCSPTSLAICWLASVVLVPLTLRARRSKESVFAPPKNPALRSVYFIVVGFSGAAAVTWFVLRLHLLGVPVIEIAAALLLVYVWIRTIQLTRQQPTE